MTESQPTWIGRTISGRYQIESLLGRGGMSSVFKATDPNLQRTVAIKIIHPHLSENAEFVRRFEQEAAAVARLRHPNIMQVHDFNHDGGTYYIVFEYIAGEGLDQRLSTLKENRMRLPLEDTLRILITLCDAVAYAHERNMIHRDIKPSNVILDLLGKPMLVDFGIAKIVGGNHVQTATGATVGTAAYMSPEQVMGEEIDHRADIYSLGILLYEMSCGQPPYQGKSAVTVMMKHVNEPLPDVRLYNSNLPDAFMSVLEKALAKNPKERFSSAVEMSSALRQVRRHIASQRDQETVSGPTPVASGAMPQTGPKEKLMPVTAPKRASQPPVTETPREEPAPARDKVEKAPTKSRLTTKLVYALLIGLVIAALIFGGISIWPLFRGTPKSAGMVHIPSGTYTVGSTQSGSSYAPVQAVALEAFWIDRYEVTNAQYAVFLADTDEEPPAYWNGNNFPPGLASHPVHGVTWDMAVAYCRWADKRLPDEAEWEVAARGSDSLLYPWGSDESSISLSRTSTYAVGTAAPNHSPFGVFDMYGNVWEWVDDPYEPVSGGLRVARGGAFDFEQDMAYRLQGDPEAPTMFNTTGFRCAATEVEVVPDNEIILEDDFSDPASGWPELTEEAAVHGYHPPDFYHVEASRSEQIATAFFGSDLANVSVESDTYVAKTDSDTGDFRYGLIVRRSGPQFYAFAISNRTKSWSVLKSTPDGLQVLAEGEDDSIQGLDANNADLLHVDANGAQLAFSINGRLATTINDADYPSGDIGFFVETFDQTLAHIHYDLIRVQQLNTAETTNSTK